MKTIIDIFWLVSGAAWLPLWIVARLLNFEPNWLRWWGNRVDNLPDAFKQWLHCHDLPFGYQLNIAFMMKNRLRPYWPIIRKRLPPGQQYSNCDPEDKRG